MSAPAVDPAGWAEHADEVATAYELGQVSGLGFVARGQQGRVWRLDTDAGPVAIKELLVRQLSADAELDVAYQEAILATGAVPMPRPLRTRTGSVLVEHGGHQLRAYDWVDLARSDTGQDPAAIGALVATIHQVAHEPGPAPHPWYDQPVRADRWAELAATSEAAAAPFAADLRTEIPHLSSLAAEIRPRRVVQTCHRDLWADNVLPTTTGGICVIDWENCGLEDPARELPMVIMDFGRGDPHRMATLYAAYRDAGGPARVTCRADFTMVIAQFGHFWESAVTGYLRATDEAGRAHELARIAELLDPPLRVGDLDDVLDALT